MGVPAALNAPNFPGRPETYVAHEWAALVTPGASIGNSASAGNGAIIDMGNYGPNGSFVLNTGLLTNTPTFNAWIEESDDQSTFTKILNTDIPTVTTASQLCTRRFIRSKRYIRLGYTCVGASGALTLSATLGKRYDKAS